MKKLFFTYLLMLVTVVNFAQEEAGAETFKDGYVHNAILENEAPYLNWEESFKKALKKSKKQNKPVLIYFTGSDWCGPCKILDKKLFHTEKFKNLADKKLILLEVDNPQNKDLVPAKKMEENYDLIRKYGVKSYPTLVFVNHKGKMIGHKKGLILPEYYYPFLESVIENY
ncbi:thioredoxin family protein [uncultured Polaribacter sp.]|uniref:thioredoxin family protein n=1 Tax=uncultured Polaribacter sp. TaxID=174711 RepID=UPI00261ED95F|nr:thioredoxin family protein [uncultured Polaribacter sp.]